MPDFVPGNPRQRIPFVMLAFLILLLAYTRATEAQQYTVFPGEDIHTIVRNAGEGATIRFAPGLYRLSRRIDPLPNQKFIGTEGVILSGSRELTNVQQDSNGRYYYAGQIQQGAIHTAEGETICQSSSPRCAHPEMLFVDGKAYEHVNDYNKLAAGKWYFDYPGNRIFIGDNPTGRLVETAITNCAICGAAHGVGVNGFEVWHFATKTENAAIEAYYVGAGLEGRSWVIENNLIHWNAAIGAVVRADGIIRNNRLFNNGQAGYGAGGRPGGLASGIVVEWNTITGNGWKGVNPFFSSGGGKISYAQSPVVQHNRSLENHDRRCYWFDLDNTDIQFKWNFAGDGCMSGVFFEMGGSAVAEFNTFEGASIGGDGNQHAAILVTNSSNVIIRFNTITLCKEGNAISIREDGGRPSRETFNIRVEDNLIEFLCGRGRNSWDVFGGAFIPAGGIDYKRNTYRTTNVDHRHFSANNVQMTITDWQKLFDTELLNTDNPIPQPTVSATMTVFATPTAQIATMTPEVVPTSTTTPVRRFVIRFSGQVIIEVIEE